MRYTDLTGERAMQSYEELGGDSTGTLIGNALFEDYSAAGQPSNPGMGVWFFRVSYDSTVGGLPIEDAISKHRREWREALTAETGHQFP